ncbi:DNA-directed RNA polymerase III, subunit Rpc31 [Kalmanozyma brasiliensis GHG001]|uniref:DNA-directed RNA polymerase III subunit n=1 Tax=Kalmanozyma brasiliensis (strain GHG001) TaxID=1365824 RepID=V5EP37_KALBG|nr:DNA-directed RNA polymerase III, subunit Rpc31 [Kalmanozyma brasiliensis GHG001]EST04688.1 DNA-directed RNA polymerase III, subunit Rpc31 [Kalmanozyma brasiliensis GHG001]
MSRGGRGGFGRGGGRAGAGSNLPPMGLSFQELGSLDKTPSKLYPEPPTVPRMERPDDKELRYASYQLMYLQEQKTSAYWPTLEQRKQGELTRFSDRYRPEAQDLPSLKSINLQKEVFPRGLWDSFMEGETKREEQKAKKAARRKINWESIDLEDRAGAEDDIGEASSEPEDLGDYEDEVDDDYGENYFDNGEDDDMGDDDGGEPAYD